jgi:hypothetical protein
MLCGIVMASLSCRSRWQTKITDLLLVDERPYQGNRRFCKGS